MIAHMRVARLAPGQLFWAYYDGSDPRPDLRQVVTNDVGNGLAIRELVDESGEVPVDKLDTDNSWASGVCIKPVPVGSDEEARLIALLALAPERVLERFER